MTFERNLFVFIFSATFLLSANKGKVIEIIAQEVRGDFLISSTFKKEPTASSQFLKSWF